jgi:hypothetical protein
MHAFATQVHMLRQFATMRPPVALRPLRPLDRQCVGIVAQRLSQAHLPEGLRGATMRLVMVHLWRVNLDARGATIWMRTVSRRVDDAAHLIVAGAIHV